MVAASARRPLARELRRPSARSAHTALRAVAGGRRQATTSLAKENTSSIDPPKEGGPGRPRVRSISSEEERDSPPSRLTAAGKSCRTRLGGRRPSVAAGLPRRPSCLSEPRARRDSGTPARGGSRGSRPARPDHARSRPTSRRSVRAAPPASLSGVRRRRRRGPAGAGSGRRPRREARSCRAGRAPCGRVRSGTITCDSRVPAPGGAR